MTVSPYAGFQFARESDRDTHHDLVEAEPDAEHDHERAGDHPAHGPEPEPEPRGMAVVGADEAHVRAHEHHPLEPEVEHPGTLRDRLAERGEHQRHARDDAARDEGGQNGLMEQRTHDA